MNKILKLSWFEKWHWLAYLMLRIFLGAFLIWGVWDNIISSDRMKEFEVFLEKFNFLYPALMAPLSVWVQFSIGISFVTGFMVRWFSLMCIFNFIVAVVMVDSASGIRGSFPSAMIIFVSIVFLTKGAGRYSFDGFFFNEK